MTKFENVKRMLKDKTKGKKIIVKGYKALNKDMTSDFEDMIYKLNKWYHEDGVNPYYSGFHFCKELINVLKYYYYNNSIFFEVEAKGIIKTDNNIKFACSDIKLIRQISNKEFEEYISNNIDSLLKNNLNELIDYLQHTSDIDILIKLSEDKNSDVRKAVASNTNTPVEILIKLSYDKNSSVRGVVAGNINTPKEILAKLSKDKDYNVRGAVAYNTNTSKEILTKLSGDDNWYVREIAKQNLKSRKDEYNNK